MSSNVVNLFGDKIGEKSWALCPCAGDYETPFTPLVLNTPKGHVIMAIVCPECRKEFPVEKGYINEENSNG